MEEEEKSDTIILLDNQNTKYNPPSNFASPTTTINLQQNNPASTKISEYLQR